MLRYLPLPMLFLSALAVAVPACRDSGSLTEPSAAARTPMTGPADRRRDRGYRPTSATLPRVTWSDGAWRVVGAGAGRSLVELDGQRVVLDGKMALDESAPYRERFRLLPDYQGCVAPHLHDRPHHQHAGRIVNVVMPKGRSVQVTDEQLRVEGTLEVREQQHAAPRLRLRAAVVEPQIDAVARGADPPRS